MPVNDYGTVTNITGKTILTHAHEDGVDGAEFDSEGSFHFELHPGVAVMIPTKLDQAWFLARPNLYEVVVKGKTLSKATPESAKASTKEKGEEIMKQPKTSKV